MFISFAYCAHRQDKNLLYGRQHIFNENIYLLFSFLGKKIGASIKNFGNTLLKCWNSGTVQKKGIFCFFSI